MQGGAQRNTAQAVMMSWEPVTVMVTVRSCDATPIYPAGYQQGVMHQAHSTLKE